MGADKPYKTGEGNEDERAIVAEMIRNPDSEHWNACYAYVKKQVRQRVRDMHSREQEVIVQDIMEKVLLNLSSFRFESALGSWLNSIVQRCITDNYRRATTQHKYLTSIAGSDDEKDEDDIAIASKSTEEVFESKEYMEGFVQALLEYAKKHKPTRDKLILKLHILDKCNQSEIAKRAGCSAPTVKNVIEAAQHYAQEKMKRSGWDQ